MSDSSDPTVDVSVLGGGVVGITAALYLELAGHSTAVYAHEIPFEDDPHPALATPYAAASVQPPSVTVREMPRLFGTSLECFSLLAEAGSMGVRGQPHFVLYEEVRPTPDYAPLVDGFERVSELDSHPQPSDAGSVYGWKFDSCFAEPPTYIARCYELYRALGGRVEKRKLTREEFLDLPGDVLVNCAGLWARELFDDPRPFEVRLGHQVLANGFPLVRDSDDRVFSYKYTGWEGEVYAYPRMGSLVLGGSRIPVDVAPGEEWDGDPDAPTRTVDGVAVPARIVETNADILADYTDADLTDADLTARYGYRPVRDPDGEGVRLDCERIDGRPVVHNYGHGGSGFSLSWGCAAEVESLVRERSDPDPGPVDVPSTFAVAERLAALIRP